MEGKQKLLDKKANGVSLSLIDVTVISTLWSIEFCNLWITSLCAYTAFVFFTREQLHSKSFENNDLSVFVVKCIGALTIAFLVDIGRFRKKIVSIFGVCLFALTPVLALLTTMSYSIWSGMIMFWPCSVLFITLPVTYSLMFNQRLNANGLQVRRIVSILEMGEAIIGWITYIALPDELEWNSPFSVVFMWVITIPLLVTLLTVLENIRKHIKGDFTIDKSVKSVIGGIRSDFQQRQRHSGRSVQHVVLFTLLLLPSLSLSMIGSALDSASNDDALPQDPVLVHLVFGFEVVTIPLLEVILAMTQMRDHTADYTIIMIAHLTNVFVLVLIVTNIRVVSPVIAVGEVERGNSIRIKRGTSTIADIALPEPGQASYMIINGDNRSVLVWPSVGFDDKPTIWNMEPGQIYTGRTSMPDEGVNVSFNMRDTSGGGSSSRATARMTGNSFHLFRIVINNNLHSLMQMVKAIKLGELSQILIVSTSSGLDSSSEVHIIGAMKQTIIQLPSVNTEALIDVPGGTTTLLYRWTEGVEKKKFVVDQTVLSLEGYEVYVVYVYNSSSVSINAVRVFHEKPPTTTTQSPTSKATTSKPTISKPTTSKATTSKETTSKATTAKPTTPKPATSKPTSTITSTIIPTPTFIPDRQLKRDPPTTQEMTAYSLVGAALGACSVAYTHFFWMETPLRLQATMYASFRVANAVVHRLTAFVFMDKSLTFTKAYTLLSLQVFTTIAHLVLGWFFHSLPDHT